jgi:hypothetical protein
MIIGSPAPTSIPSVSESKGFKGCLHVAGYSGYNNLLDVTLVGCLSICPPRVRKRLKIIPPGSETAKESS